MQDDRCPARQLYALCATALAAPLATVCAGRGWQWVLLAAVAAGLYHLYIVRRAAALPAGAGYGMLLRAAWGRPVGGGLLALYWLWLTLSVGGAALLGAGAFPMDKGFPLIPLALTAIAALAAAKGCGAAGRFGGVLFLLLAALLGGLLAFAAAGVGLQRLAPAGTPREGALPLAILLLPSGGLFLRGSLTGRDAPALRWYALAAGLAVAVSIACAGTLGRPLAAAAAHPFWLMSRSVSVLGVVERFEAAVSSLLAAGCCALLAFLLCLCGQAARAALPVGRGAAVWGSAAAGFGAAWLAAYVPGWLWALGNGLFWGVLPALTLAVVSKRKSAEFEKNS